MVFSGPCCDGRLGSLQKVFPFVGGAKGQGNLHKEDSSVPGFDFQRDLKSLGLIGAASPAFRVALAHQA